MPKSSITGILIFSLAVGSSVQAADTRAVFPAYLSDHFDFATFTRFEASTPPRAGIYQSNGFMAIKEDGFGPQKIIVPIQGVHPPTNTTDRTTAFTVDRPVFFDASGRHFDLASSAAQRTVVYFADRTIYRAAFASGPKVSLTVYPAYGKPVAVFRIDVLRTPSPLRVQMRTLDGSFRSVSSAEPHSRALALPGHLYRSLVTAVPQTSTRSGDLHWTLNSGGSAALLVAVGGDASSTTRSLNELLASKDLLDRETHERWNQYLSSVPLVAPAEPVQFTVGTSGEQHSIGPEDLVRSELWFWRGLLNTTCQAAYLPACPMVIADWSVFMGMWSNDGVAEAIALAGTGRSDLARASLLSWFRYSVNAQGDGTSAWTIFPSGTNTFHAAGPERDTQGVPVQAMLVGEYVRLTGDASILDERPGGVAGDRTVWQALLAYEANLLRVRDVNHDHLIDWLHEYETGWDDKDSPYVDRDKHPTSAVNEQVDHLWSLQEMVYLSRLRHEDSPVWQKEFEAAKHAVRDRLWDSATARYWDLDIATGNLWTVGENLDAYYFLYFETDPARIHPMLSRLNDPSKFDGALLPTLSFDTPNWGGYWRGPAWPRIFPYVGLALDRSGNGMEGFNWLVRAINSNLGPLIPESVDPKSYPPGEHAKGPVRIMGYDALGTLVLPDLAGLRTWAGQDLTIHANRDLGKIFVRGQRWMGDRYDAVFEADHPTRIWMKGRELPSLPPSQTWRARRQGDAVTFDLVEDSMASHASDSR